MGLGIVTSFEQKDKSLKSQPLSRDNSFDLVRLLAAMSVLVAHQLSMAGAYFPEYGPPTIGPWGPKLADAGLYVFFALSGYLIFQSLTSDKGIVRFVLARILRIYPGAIINTAVCILLGSLITTFSQSEFWSSDLVRSYALHNTLILFPPTQFSLPGFLTQSPFPAVNTPVWTLKYELVAYIILLLLFLSTVHSRLGSILSIGVAFGAMLVCFYFTRAYPRQDGIGLDSLGTFYLVHIARFFTVFFFGALYAKIEQIDGTKHLLLATLGTLQLFSLVMSDPLARISFILLLSVAAIELGKSSLLHSTFYQKIGDLSYGTYLYAFPIQMITVTYFLNSWNFWLLTLADMFVILLIAKASWTLVERPSLRLKKQLNKKLM